MKRSVWLCWAFSLSVLCTRPSDGEVVVSKPGQDVKIECGVMTSQTTVTWSRENVRIIGVGKMGMPTRGNGDLASRSSLRKTTLQIKNVKETDAGTFTCKVDQTSEEHLLLLVTVSASPSAVLQRGSEASLQCQVRGLTPEPETRWSKPDGGLHPEPRVVQLKPVALSDHGAWNCKFSHAGATYAETLDVTVTEPRTTPATTPARPVPPNKKSEDQGCGLDCEPPHHPPWWLWAVIGVCGLVVVLLTVLVVCLCKRFQRRKRKLRKLKNSHQLQRPKQFCQCNRPTAVPKLQQRRLREKPSAPPLQPLLVQ